MNTPQTTPDNTPPTPTPYEAIGGAAAVRRLVDRFYQLMDELPEAYTVRRIHPESLAGSADSLFDFLSGWFGGPPLYSQKKGHPRLRMRHRAYTIGPVERDEWMLCMTLALNEQVADAALREALVHTFAAMADHLVNTNGSSACRHASAATA
jgi:hemoglobin